MRSRALPWTSLVLAGCMTQAQQSPQNQQNYRTVPIAAGIGVAGAAISRAGGGCYAMCAYGTTCNPDNGACEPTNREDGPGATSMTVPIGPSSPGPADPSVTGPTPTSTPMPALRPSTLGPIDVSCGGACTADEYCNVRPDRGTECLRKATGVPTP